jgi:hypothetical protein
MKAKDIIPLVAYEVRPYAGGERRAVITKVEKRKIRVYEGRDMWGRDSHQWRAIEVLDNGKEIEFPLSQVIRPWSEAESDHKAAEQDQYEGRKIKRRLEMALQRHGITVALDGNKSYNLGLSREQADTLSDLLNKLPD